MNLTDYFDGVDFKKLNNNQRLNIKYSLGSSIEKNTLALSESNFEKVEIAIVGVPFETVDNESQLIVAPNEIRKHLYRLAAIEKLNIVDLGNLKMAQSHKGNYLALRDVVDYLSELNITALVIGGSEDFAYGITQAFRNNKFFTFSAIDAFLDVKQSKEPYQCKNYLSRIFRKQPNIFQFNLIAYQRHHVPGKELLKTKGVNQHIGLGEITNNFGLTEPVFRNSNFVTMDLSSVKFAEGRGKKMLPNGLSNEATCQLARYAGLSDKLNVFALFEVNPEEDLNCKLAAEVAWYFIEGRTQKMQVSLDNEDEFTIHKVEVWQIETPLVFHEHNATGRWWLKLQSIGNSFVFMACSPEDYLAASHNEIPEIYLKYVQKIDELLK